MEYLIFLLCLGLVAVGGLQVGFRYFLNRSLTWSEELSRYLFIWLVFFTIGVGLRRKAHIGMNSLVERLPLWARRVLAFLSNLIVLAFSCAVMFFTVKVSRVAMIQITPALGIPMGYVYLGMIIGGAYLFTVGLRDFIGIFAIAGRRGGT